MLALTTNPEPRNLLIDFAFLGLSTITRDRPCRPAIAGAGDVAAAFFGGRGGGLGLGLAAAVEAFRFAGALALASVSGVSDVLAVLRATVVLFLAAHGAGGPPARLAGCLCGGSWYTAAGSSRCRMAAPFNKLAYPALSRGPAAGLRPECRDAESRASGGDGRLVLVFTTAGPAAFARLSLAPCRSARRLPASPAPSTPERVMPFAVFRKHQRKLLAIFAILAMFGFVLSDSLPALVGGRAGRGGGNDPVVAKLNWKTVRYSDLEPMRRPAAAGQRFMSALIQRQPASPRLLRRLLAPASWWTP